MSDSSESDDYNNDDDLNLNEDSEEEVFASESDDDDDDDHYEDDDRFSRFKIELKKDEMASDLEDNDDDDDDDDDDGLPDAKAWGKDKKTYYHTDYVDKDFRNQKQRDRQLAQYEEEEALEIQKRLLESISGGQDMGMDLLMEMINDNKSLPKSSVEQEVVPSVQRSKHIVKQQSPELEPLKIDFERYYNEINDQLKPMVSELNHYDNDDSVALQLLKLRLILLCNYCAHISLYFSMQSVEQNKQSIQNHPIIKRLFTYKTFIQQMDNVIQTKKLFTQQIQFVLQSIRHNQPIHFIPKQSITNDLKTKVINNNDDDNNIDIDDDDDDDDIDNDNDNETTDKRAITYEMEKNKGLTPKRKREQRNPRVKYRRKYERAVIRRKGQVRQPRKELQKYGGELTGINVRSIKSVKFK